MKPYGTHRHDMQHCRYGCCGYKAWRRGRSKASTLAVDRAARKRARREGRS